MRAYMSQGIQKLDQVKICGGQSLKNLMWYGPPMHTLEICYFTSFN